MTSSRSSGEPSRGNAILYEVEATFSDATLAAAWARWIVDEHIAELIEAGASRGRLIRLDGDDLSYVAQYEFESRAALDAYLANHAPRLREAGIKRFGLEKVSYARRVGEIL